MNSLRTYPRSTSFLRLQRPGVAACSTHSSGARGPERWVDQAPKCGCRIAVNPLAAGLRGVNAGVTEAGAIESQDELTIKTWAVQPSPPICTHAGAPIRAPAHPVTMLRARRAHFVSTSPTLNERVGSGLPEPLGYGRTSRVKGLPVGTSRHRPEPCALSVRALNMASPFRFFP